MKPSVVSFPPDSVITDFVQPGFYTGPPPHLSHAELIPAPTRAVLDDRWGMVHPARRIALHSLRNVFVVGEGLVFDQDGNLYTESISQNSEQQIEAATRELRDRLHTKNIRYYPGATLLCGKAGLSNYGHWMVEMLPIAYLCRHWIAEGWDIYVPKVHGWMDEVVPTSLGLLGIEAGRCAYGDGQPWFFQDLVYTSGLSVVGLYYLPVAVETMRSISVAIPAKSAERIWIARIDRAGLHRSMADEAALCRHLSAKGWLILNPAGMTLVQQISACKGARHIAGVAGAGLTNAGYMQPGGRVTCFMPADMPDIFFLHLTHHAGLDYREIRCLTAPSGQLTLSKEQVLAALE